MQWGITFSVAAIHEVELWGLPPPSQIERVQRWDSIKVINVLYHFLYAPQSRQEWQRLASIKTQIKNKIESVKFQEYEPLEVTGRVYSISELGKHFKAFVKFPAPYFEGTAQMTLTRHAKRLHYEGLLHIEQLIFLSFWIADIAPQNETGRRPKKEGVRQIMRRAMSAMKFAEDHKDDWKVKLNADDLIYAHRRGATKTNQIKREKMARKIERAKKLRDAGKTLLEISSLLNVSLRSVSNYLR